LQGWREQSGLRSAAIVDGKLRLVLNNTLAAVEDGRCAVVEFLVPLDSRVQNRLEVVFEELVTNTVRHGFAGDFDHSIHVEVERGASAITLTFEDDGLPFNPTEADASARADAGRVGGLGIPLIVKMSNALCYEQLNPDTLREGFSPRNRTKVSVNT
jgi:anti-sigma regulatory factor (Ser/Thr protein kinase)